MAWQRHMVCTVYSRTYAVHVRWMDPSVRGAVVPSKGITSKSHGTFMKHQQLQLKRIDAVEKELRLLHEASADAWIVTQAPFWNKGNFTENSQVCHASNRRLRVATSELSSLLERLAMRKELDSWGFAFSVNAQPIPSPLQLDVRMWGSLLTPIANISLVVKTTNYIAKGKFVLEIQSRTNGEWNSTMETQCIVIHWGGRKKLQGITAYMWQTVASLSSPPLTQKYASSPHIIKAFLYSCRSPSFRSLTSSSGLGSVVAIHGIY